MDEKQEDLCICPSFNCYSGDKLAESAAKISEEFRRSCKITSENSEDKAEENDGDDGFEFTLVRDDRSEVFLQDGVFGQVFPVFNRDLLEMDRDFTYRDHEFDDEKSDPRNRADRDESKSSTIRIPLKTLFIDERHEVESSSSSEVDELDAVPPGTYCVWRPKMTDSPSLSPSPSSSPGWCKKSKSTGSVSKRWNFRHLLKRSNSDGKDSFVFLTPKFKERSEKKSSGDNPTKLAGKTKAPPPPVEASYVRKGRERRRSSYLPYRKDLVGFFANVNGVGRSFPPF